MKKLTQKEWIAVSVSVFVVGFFFIFGQSVISLFTPSQTNTMNILTNGMTIVDTEIGTGAEAVSGKTVSVEYTGKFTDGRVFDSSIPRGTPFSFVLGAGQVILGWERGIVGMKVGGSRTLTVPPELGYGPQDYGPIPGNSTLMFEVKLVDVK
jgi:peptidylprolyl isomerase/FKBP-type peptidyl-prolyl cis-trans isomerase FkpA